MLYSCGGTTALPQRAFRAPSIPAEVQAVSRFCKCHTRTTSIRVVCLRAAFGLTSASNIRESRHPHRVPATYHPRPDFPERKQMCLLDSRLVGARSKWKGIGDNDCIRRRPGSADPRFLADRDLAFFKPSPWLAGTTIGPYTVHTRGQYRV